MEFLRFGSRRGGKNIGCCAIDIIQGFSVDPDEVIENPSKLLHGDGGHAISKDGSSAHAGTTYREQFLNHLRIGTFSGEDLPDRVFYACLTAAQMTYTRGQKWLAILKENGFEFIRATNNSVYNKPPNGDIEKGSSVQHPVYIFALYRNISKAKLPDPLQPPQVWLDLPECTKTHEEIWKEGKTTLHKYEEPKKVAKGDTPFPINIGGAAAQAGL